MIINIVILIVMILAALWTTMATRLLRSAVGLAITSAILSILIFRLGSPIAAVFELSVCAGLIFAIFISSISVTRRIEIEQLVARKQERLRKYWLLPVIIVLATAGLFLVNFKMNFNLPAQPVENNVKVVLWHLRHLDLLGQIVILVTGAFGVVILFKESKDD